MKHNNQLSIATLFVLTTAFAVLLALFRFSRAYSQSTYVLLCAITMALTILGTGLILAAFAGYWDNRFSPGLTSCKGKDVIGVMYIGTCFLLPALAFCFDAYASAV